MPIGRVLSLSFVLLSAISSAVLAEDAPSNRDRGGPPGDHSRWDPAAMRQHEEARHAERTKALHDVLAIQPSQETTFAAFTAAMSTPERRDGGPDARGGPGESAERRAAMTTPERLDRMKARMDRKFAEMREAFDRRAEATKTLYAALDPRQRAAMDALPELSRHGRGGGHMGHAASVSAGM